MPPGPRRAHRPPRPPDRRARRARRGRGRASGRRTRRQRAISIRSAWSSPTAAAWARRRSSRGGQEGVHRPEAARHPQHGRARDRANRQARRLFPHRPRLSPDDARGGGGRQGLAAEAAGGFGSHLLRRRRSRRSRLRLGRPRRWSRAAPRRRRPPVSTASSPAPRRPRCCAPRSAIRCFSSRRAFAPPAPPSATRSASPRRLRRSPRGADYLVVGRPVTQARRSQSRRAADRRRDRRRAVTCHLERGR